MMAAILYFQMKVIFIQRIFRTNAGKSERNITITKKLSTGLRVIIVHASGCDGLFQTLFN